MLLQVELSSEFKRYTVTSSLPVSNYNFFISGAVSVSSRNKKSPAAKDAAGSGVSDGPKVRNGSSDASEIGGGGNDYSSGDEPADPRQERPKTSPKLPRQRDLPIANATNATLTSEASAVDPQNATAGGPADNVTHGAGNRAADFRNRAADFRGGADNHTAPVWNSTQAGSPNTEEKVVPPPRGNNKMAAQQFPNQTLLPPGLDRRILASALHKLSRLNLDLSSTLK